MYFTVYNQSNLYANRSNGYEASIEDVNLTYNNSVTCFDDLDSNGNWIRMVDIISNDKCSCKIGEIILKSGIGMFELIGLLMRG